MSYKRFILVPTYAPLFILLRRYNKFEERTFDLVWAAYQALVRLLKESPPMYVGLSLADFKAASTSIRMYVNNLLLKAKQCGIKVLIDCGGLERLFASDEYFIDKICFEDPVTNLKEQLLLQPRPDIVTLLDDIRCSCTFENLLSREFTRMLCGLQHYGVKVLLVIHDKDIEAIDSLTRSKLFKCIDYIAMPDRELKSKASILSRLRILKKGLMIFGMNDFSPMRILNLIEYGVFMGDITMWLNARLVFRGRNSVEIKEIELDKAAHFNHFYLGELVNQLYRNLLILQMVENFVKNKVD